MKRKLLRSLCCIMSSLLLLLIPASSAGAVESYVSPIGSEISVEDSEGDIIEIEGIERDISYAETGVYIPSYYSSRDLGYTTKAKDQTRTNLCWAFNAASSLETYMNKTYGHTDSYSPLHLGYVGSQKENGSGWILRPDWLTSGGRSEIAIGCLTSLQGAKETYLETLEEIDTNSSGLTSREAGYREIAKEFDETHRTLACVDNIIYVNTDGSDAVKEAVMECGSINATFGVGYSCFDSTKTNYYCNDIDAATAGGHAILIIGWDDDYPKENFTGACTPSSDGAWICQNSWGEDSGDNGVFYLSFEDATIFNEKYGLIWGIKSAHNVGRFESMYQLDEAGAFQDYAPWSTKDEIIYMNKFDFAENEYMERVNFETESMGAKYKIYLIPIKSTGAPDSYSKWTLLKSGIVDHSGYTSVDIPMEIESGEHFIGVSLTKSGNSGNDIGITRNLDTYYSIEDLKEGVSYAAYLSLGSVKRYDMYNKEGLFCIKVQTTKNYRYGDADFNKTVTISDATLIQNYISHKIDESSINLICADTNDDSDITISDSTEIQMHLAGMSSSSKAGELIR